MTCDSVSTVSFTRARKDARVVAERATHVGVVYAKVEEFAAEFTPPPPAVLPRGVDPDHLLEFLLLRATLRFGSGYEPKLTLRPGGTAAEALDTALVDRFAKLGPFTPRDMIHATPDDVATLRGQGLIEPPQAEFVELQTRALRDLGRFLTDRHEGSAQRVVESAGGSAARLCEALATMPFFHDVQRYRGIDVHFFHRGQRFVLDVATAEHDEPLGHFDDLRDLSPSSDAECALALRVAGALVHDAQLKDRVDHGEIVPAHSEREVEIRAAALHAADRLLTAIQVTRPTVSSADVDRWLRGRAREARVAGLEPHRTRSVHY